MDNLCHSLLGAALAEAGLKKRTALATATLVLGANLPDVDVFSYFWGEEAALGFRRGWTHGVLALALWPFLLTGIMMLWDRSVRRRRTAAGPARPGALLLLSAIAVLTHPLLDWLNTYGMRWLMPFRDVWYYGDVLFIMDPWIWLALGTGWLASRQLSRWGSRGAERPARVALAAVSLYILALWGSRLAAVEVARKGMGERGIAAGRLMAGPLPVNPFRRQIVAVSGERYVLGTIDWLHQPRFAPGSPPFVERNEDPRLRAAIASTAPGRSFLHWARFPFYRAAKLEDGTLRVSVTDARYTLRPGTGFGRLTLELPNPHPLAPSPVPSLPPQRKS